MSKLILDRNNTGLLLSKVKYIRSMDTYREFPDDDLMAGSNLYARHVRSE